MKSVDIQANTYRVVTTRTRIVAALLGAAFLFGCKEVSLPDISGDSFKLPPKVRAFPAPPAEDPKYPRYDPYQPLYQGNRFWRDRKSAPPTKKIDWREQHKIELSNLGFDMLKWGAVGAVLGIAFCLSVQNELADAAGAFVAAAGLISIGFGMGFLWITEIWQWMVYAATAGATIWLVMRFRGRGLKFRKPKPSCKIPPEPVE